MHLSSKPLYFKKKKVNGKCVKSDFTTGADKHFNTNEFQLEF